MRIALPTNGDKGMDEEVCPHFGRAVTYTIYDTETKDVEVVENTSNHMGGSGLPPDLLHEKNVDALICGGIGRKAIELFNSKGIKVYSGAIDTVKDTIELFEVGILNEASSDSACSGHHHTGECNH
ncbi:MAG TPA: NifB/NifX family molybdenum-iron cluster-binding protein [Candidatus Methanofastidiosa archaeon]|nr:NifB/NifX family molybdenum-iron cluster-binding protein [Candidatus Methanofastidiosa archaeon]HPR41583.1 NifB/NifX family molybdenum-iron cluster-binding protein [Candidatus Methanofastidiosa archaeon]